MWFQFFFPKDVYTFPFQVQSKGKNCKKRVNELGKFCPTKICFELTFVFVYNSSSYFLKMNDAPFQKHSHLIILQLWPDLQPL